MTEKTNKLRRPSELTHSEKVLWYDGYEDNKELIANVQITIGGGEDSQGQIVNEQYILFPQDLKRLRNLTYDARRKGVEYGVAAVLEESEKMIYEKIKKDYPTYTTSIIPPIAWSVNEMVDSE